MSHFHRPHTAHAGDVFVLSVTDEFDRVWTLVEDSRGHSFVVDPVGAIHEDPCLRPCPHSDEDVSAFVEFAAGAMK